MCFLLRFYINYSRLCQVTVLYINYTRLCQVTVLYQLHPLSFFVVWSSIDLPEKHSPENVPDHLSGRPGSFGSRWRSFGLLGGMLGGMVLSQPMCVLGVCDMERTGVGDGGGM